MSGKDQEWERSLHNWIKGLPSPQKAWWISHLCIPCCWQNGHHWQNRHKKVVFLFPRFHPRHTAPTQYEKQTNKKLCALFSLVLWYPVLLGGIAVPSAEPGAATTPWRKYDEQLLLQVRLGISVKEQKAKLRFLGIPITAQQAIESVLPKYFNGNRCRNHRDYGSWEQTQKLYVGCSPWTASLCGALRKDWSH